MSTTFQGNTGTSLQAFDPSFGPNTPGRDLSAYMTSVNSIAILTPEHERIALANHTQQLHKTHGKLNIFIYAVASLQEEA